MAERARINKAAIWKGNKAILASDSLVRSFHKATDVTFGDCREHSAAVTELCEDL